ncbi:MAG: SDR family NAD(P)-dependent oxidoreductase [Myxococcota bacterium]
MSKKILITGATSGIGLETALALANQGHHLLVHGRSTAKLEALENHLTERDATVSTYAADLSSRSGARGLAEAVRDAHEGIDVLINNAGIFEVAQPLTEEGFDVRFAVNTFAPFILAAALGPLLRSEGRIINLSSAAQSPVDLAAMAGQRTLPSFEAYAQSKLALTMWSCRWGRRRGDEGPIVIAVNPGSMLGTKMVAEAFGSKGKDVGIGVRALQFAALDPAAAHRNGTYFDQDRGDFGPPHPDALDDTKCDKVIAAITAHTSA